jgi:hypothetical protein
VWLTTQQALNTCSPYLLTTQRALNTFSPYLLTTQQALNTFSPHLLTTQRALNTFSPYLLATQRALNTFSPYLLAMIWCCKRGLSDHDLWYGSCIYINPYSHCLSPLFYSKGCGFDFLKDQLRTYMYVLFYQ